MRIQQLLLVGALGATLFESASGQSVTFDFTGNVQSVRGSFGPLAVGSPVEGTFTFDLAALDPKYSYTNIGAPFELWYAATNSGLAFGTPPSKTYLFRDVVGGAGYSFDSTSGPSPIDLKYEFLQGDPSLVPLAPTPTIVASGFTAQSFLTDPNGDLHDSGLSLSRSGAPDWTSTGPPNFEPNRYNDGFIEYGNLETLNQLQFSINTFTVSAVPEPPQHLLVSFGPGSSRAGVAAAPIFRGLFDWGAGSPLSASLALLEHLRRQRRPKVRLHGE